MLTITESFELGLRVLEKVPWTLILRVVPDGGIQLKAMMLAILLAIEFKSVLHKVDG